MGKPSINIIRKWDFEGIVRHCEVPSLKWDCCISKVAPGSVVPFHKCRQSEKSRVRGGPFTRHPLCQCLGLDFTAASEEAHPKDFGYGSTETLTSHKKSRLTSQEGEFSSNSMLLELWLTCSSWSKEDSPSRSNYEPEEVL